MSDSWGVPVHKHTFKQTLGPAAGVLFKILGSVSQNQVWSRMVVEFRVNNSARFGHH